MGSPWSVAQRDTLNVRSPAGAGGFLRVCAPGQNLL